MSKALNTIKTDLVVPASLEVAKDVYDSLGTKAKVRLYVVERFNAIFLVSLLDRVLEEMPHSVLSPALWINVLEEKGLIEAYGPEDHEACRNNLASAIGVELRPSIPKEMKDIIASESLHFLIGILFYIEYQVPDEYESMLKRIREFFPDATDDELFHLLNHIEHDQHHFEDIMSRLSVSRGLDIDQFEAGIRFMHKKRMTLVNFVNAL